MLVFWRGLTFVFPLVNAKFLLPGGNVVGVGHHFGLGGEKRRKEKAKKRCSCWQSPQKAPMWVPGAAGLSGLLGRPQLSSALSAVPILCLVAALTALIPPGPLEDGSSSQTQRYLHSSLSWCTAVAKNVISMQKFLFWETSRAGPVGQQQGWAGTPEFLCPKLEMSPILAPTWLFCS